jgi:hypothetical protein
MAGTTLRRRVGVRSGAERALLAEYNKLVDDVELLRSKFAAVLTKLDADGGVTDVNYSSLHTVAAASLTAAQIADGAGSIIT